MLFKAAPYPREYLEAVERNILNDRADFSCVERNLSCICFVREEKVSVGMTLNESCDGRDNVSERGKIKMIFFEMSADRCAVCGIFFGCCFWLYFNVPAGLLCRHFEKRNTESHFSCGSCCVKVETSTTFAIERENGSIETGAVERPHWEIDLDIPIFKGDDREYINKRIFYDELPNVKVVYVN